jgi:hypothetical protein
MHLKKGRKMPVQMKSSTTKMRKSERGRLRTAARKKGAKTLLIHIKRNKINLLSFSVITL